MVGHLGTVHSSYGTDKLVCHRADGNQVVLHRQIDIAGPDKLTAPLPAPVTVSHRPDHRLFRLERNAAARPEIAVHATGFQQADGFPVSLPVIILIIETAVFARHPVIKLGNNGQHFHFQQDGIGPTPFELHGQIPFFILPYCHPFATETVAFQVGVEPTGNVTAPPFHERDFLVRDDHVLQQDDLFLQLVGKTRRIDGMVPVGKPILHLSAGKIVDDRAAHGELIQVVVCKMIDNSFHTKSFCLISLFAKFPPVSCPIQLAGLALPNASLTVKYLVPERRRTENLHPAAVCRKHGVRR